MASTVVETSDLLCGLEDRPALPDTLLVALQHVLAMFVGIITPPLIIGGALKLSPADTAYLVSMALFVSGVATFLQTSPFWSGGLGVAQRPGRKFHLYLADPLSLWRGYRRRWQCT